jgi:MoaA/NifB/PqqE/SkfB family radical SAM enzyme
MRSLKLFDKEVLARSWICSESGGEEISDLKYNLYIEASSFCPAKCGFCNYDSKIQEFDVQKLSKVIEYLSSRDLINRISITGGEPLTSSVLYDIVSLCKGYNLSINTSGYNFHKLLALENLNLFSDIHISRHHYNDIVNNTIFGINLLGKEDIKSIIEKEKLPISLSCNLMKSYINSSKEIKSYLDQAIDIGVGFVGFVGLMNKNSFCLDQRIDYEDIEFKLSDGFLMQKFNASKDYCKCSNYKYFNQDDEISFYLRSIQKRADFLTGFVFTNNNLIDGFKGEVVI